MATVTEISQEVSYRTDIYFHKSRMALSAAKHNPRVVYQIFQRQHATLCGMKYVQELLAGIPGIELWGLKDGDRIEPMETVALLTGQVQDLVEYETLYLGYLARLTKIASNVSDAVLAARGKPILFFPARFDLFVNQEYDGYAARVGGVYGYSTAAQANGDEPVGTMPHALIAAFRGDTLAATVALLEAKPNEPVWPLVDFHNDCGKTAVEVYNGLKTLGLDHMMAGVRLDTSQSLVDEGIAQNHTCDCGKNFNLLKKTGVNPCLVKHVRESLDKAGANQVKICVSGGFDTHKITMFEDLHVPADVYAIGEKFLLGSYAFTSDIVGYYEGQRLIPCAKIGRGYKPNNRLARLI